MPMSENNAVGVRAQSEPVPYAIPKHSPPEPWSPALILSRPTSSPSHNSPVCIAVNLCLDICQKAFWEDTVSEAKRLARSCHFIVGILRPALSSDEWKSRALQSAGRHTFDLQLAWAASS